MKKCIDHVRLCPRRYLTSIRIIISIAIIREQKILLFLSGADDSKKK